jgi:5-methylcytosine-specific restriction endonuclease McrA
MKKYSDLLKSKKWLQKRKYILARDGNKCTVCNSKYNLQVHHIFYYADKPNPWLYPNKYLITLCDDCHKDYHLHNEIEIKKKETKSAKRRKKKRDKVTLLKKYKPLSEQQMERELRVKRITG